MRFSLSKRVKLLLAGMTVVFIALILVVNFTSACRLKTVTYNDEEFRQAPRRLGLDTTRTIFEQPLDSLARVLLAKREIFKVDIGLALPGRIAIKTNGFETVALALDRTTGEINGISQDGRVLPLPDDMSNWEQPVMTSISCGRYYGFADDIRVVTVAMQLQKLKYADADLYRLIDEIDFGNSGFLKVSVDGLGYRLKARAEFLFEDLNRFAEFVGRYTPDLESVKLLDLRFDEMIICEGPSDKSGS